MRDELEKKLIEKYPEIFADVDKPQTESLMCFGCCCGDGWYDLIDALCQALQDTTTEMKEPQIVAFQIKEKFGTLRFYCSPTTRTQASIINFAQVISGKTCEFCSMGDAKIREGRYIRTLCDKCHEKKGKQNE